MPSGYSQLKWLYSKAESELRNSKEWAKGYAEGEVEARKIDSDLERSEPDFDKRGDRVSDEGSLAYDLARTTEEFVSEAMAYMELLANIEGLTVRKSPGLAVQQHLDKFDFEYDRLRKVFSTMSQQPDLSEWKWRAGFASGLSEKLGEIAREKYGI